MGKLAEFHKKYELIMQAKINSHERDEKLGELMTDMEKQYKIPALRDKSWEKDNKAIIALYRKLSMSRELK